MNYFDLISAILNTLAVCGLSICVALPIGTFLALLLVRTNVFGRSLAWLALASQLGMPLYVFAGGWSAGFGYQGWLNPTAWLTPTALDAAQSPIAALLAVALIHSCASIPWICLILAMGLMWSDRGQEDTARLEGGWPQTLWMVVLPKLRPWLLASCLWSILPILTEMVVTNLYQVPTVAEQVYLDASRGTLRPLTYLAGVGFCFLPVACMAWIVWRRFPKWQDVIYRLQNHPPTPLKLERLRIPASLLVWTIVFALVGLPLVNLFVKAGWQPQSTASGSTSYGWSIERFLTTFIESLTLFQSEFYWSAVLAIVSSLLALLVAATLLTWLPNNLRPWISLVTLLMIALPGPLIGMVVIWIFNRNTPEILGRLYDTTLVAPVLAQQFRLLPLAWLLMQTIRVSIPQQVWELSVVDQLTYWQRFRLVLVPHAGFRCATSLLLLGLVSVGELSCTILLLPPGVTTVSMRLFELLHFGMRHQDSGLCILLMLLGWLASLVFWKTLKDR